MSDAVTFLAYYEKRESDLTAPEKLGSFVNRLRQEGYALTNGLAWPFTAPKNLIDDPARIEQAIVATCQPGERVEHLHFWKHPFEFGFAPDAAGGEHWLLYVLNDTLLGGNNDLGEQNSVEFIKVVTLALETYPPDYGCAFGLQHDSPTSEAVRAKQVAEVYPINFYGQAYVAKLGKSRLLEAPAQVKGVVAQGVLLVPSLRAVYADDPAGVLKVKQHLGWA